MLQSSSSSLLPPKPPPPLLTQRRVPTSLYQRRPLLVAASPPTMHGDTATAGVRSHVPARPFHLHVLRTPPAAASSPCFASSCTGTSLGSRSPGPELGLLSLFFVISMVMGSLFAVAIVSLPAMAALRKLSVEVNRLSRMVSEEVPGTLLSLKLSGQEINELTEQLSSVRRLISGNRDHNKEDRMKKRKSKRGGDDPLIV